MEAVRTYLLSVVSAAILCGIVMQLLGKQGTMATIGKLLCGLFLALTVVSPWTKLQISDFSDYMNDLNLDASDAVREGQNMADDAAEEIIKSQLEAYILDKADSLGLDLTVEVTLCDDEWNTPQAVTISGNASPYAKTRLQQYLTEELGISKEDQTWTR